MGRIVPDKVKPIMSVRKSHQELILATLVGNQVDLGASFPEKPKIVV